MLASLVKAAVEEVAFEGAPGISWTGLCSRLKTRGITLDSFQRNALWAQCISRPEFVLRSPDGKELSDEPLRKLPQDAPNEDEEPKEEEVATEAASRGGCSKKKDKKKKSQNGRTAVDKEVLFDIPEKLRLHLVLLAPHPELAENSMALKAFQMITRTRHEGCWAAFLALELGIIPRDLFYQIEGLRLAGLVLSIHASMPPQVLKDYHDRTGQGHSCKGLQSIHSNLLFHVRFYESEQVEAAQMMVLVRHASDPVAKRILQVLSESDDKVVFESDLRALAGSVVEECEQRLHVNSRMAGRLYQRVRQQLQEQRLVECVRVWHEASNAFRDALCEYGAHPAREDKSVCLAIEDGDASHHYGSQASQASSKSPATEEMEASQQTSQSDQVPASSSSLPATSTTAPSVVRVLERPLSTQVLDLIECSGTAGVTSPEIAEILGIARKATERVLLEMLRMTKVVKVLESDGKMHVNRYLSKSHAETACAPPASAGLATSGVGKDTSQTETSLAVKRPAINLGRGRDKRTKRLDTTFQRRTERARDLVEQRGVVTSLDLRTALHESGGNESKYMMDRRSAKRILEAAMNEDSRVQLSQTHGRWFFAYWVPKFTEEAAWQQVQKESHQRHLCRWQGQSEKRKSKTLAIADDPTRIPAIANAPDAGMETCNLNNASEALTEDQSHNPALGTHRNAVARNAVLRTHRRVLPDVVVGSRVLGISDRYCQKVSIIYGYQTPAMVRAQLLHEHLVREFCAQDGADSPAEDSCGMSAAHIVDAMDLSVFLQVIGCAQKVDYVEDLLRRCERMPRVRELPTEVYKVLISRTYAGAPRALLAVRRLLGHLVKLELVRTEEHAVSIHGAARGTGPVKVTYHLCRHVQLHTMTSSMEEEPPSLVGSFDLAEPAACARYWKQLQELAEGWILHVQQLQQDEQRVSLAGDRAEGSDECQPAMQDERAVSVPLPANALLPELFQKKNWKHTAWLTPEQRLALHDFQEEVEASAEKAAAQSSSSQSECAVSVWRAAPKVVTPTSLEVIALSQKIGIAPDRIVKHCKNQAELHGQYGKNPPVIYSSLYNVRYRCHICSHLCYQSNTIEEHYQRVHDQELPEDSSVFCEPDFYACRLERTKEILEKPEQQQRRRKRRRQLADISSGSGSEPEARGLAYASAPSPPVVPAAPRSVWGDKSSDDAAWLRLLVVAEQLAAQKCGVRSRVLSQIDVDADTWPVLALITGRSTGYCRRRVRKLLKSCKQNARTVSVLRTQAARDRVTTEGASELLWALSRAAAKSLVLSQDQAAECWVQDAFTRDVQESLGWVFRQWQMQGLVCKFKPSAHKCKTSGAKPRYLLTWQSRQGLFGRMNEFVRWHEYFHHVEELHENSGGETLPHESTGSLVQVLAEMLSDDTFELKALWEDRDFYDVASECLHSAKEDDRSGECPDTFAGGDEEEQHDYASTLGSLDRGAEDDDDSPSDAEDRPEGAPVKKVSGVAAHLKLTADVPPLSGVEFSLNSNPTPHSTAKPALHPAESQAAQLLEWLRFSEEEVKKLAPNSSSEPLDPFCVNAADSTALLHSARQGRKAASKSEMCASMATAAITAAKEPRLLDKDFAVYASSANLDVANLQILQEAAAYLFRIVLTSGCQEEVSAESGSGWQSCAVDALRDQFDNGFQKHELTGEDQQKLFDTALACLEELRLLVPLACGSQFHEVLASAIAAYCLRPKTSAEAGAQNSHHGLEPLGLFWQPQVGYHWGCDPAPNAARKQLLCRAAAAVAKAARVGIQTLPVQGHMLPWGFVAPAPWVDGTGAPNALFMRLLSVKLLQQLAKIPGTRADELAKQCCLLDECEVELVLQRFVAAGLAEVNEGPNSKRVYFPRPLYRAMSSAGMLERRDDCGTKQTNRQTN